MTKNNVFRTTSALFVSCAFFSCALPCPPRKDPHFSPTTATGKPSAANVAGVYTDSWVDWPGMYNETWDFKADGTGSFVRRVDWMNQPEPYIQPLQMTWNTGPDGNMAVQLNGSFAHRMCNKGKYAMRWTKDGLHNLSTGRLLPRFGTPVHFTKRQQASAKHASNSAIDAAIEGTLQGVILGAGTAMVANQAASGTPGLGGSGAASAMGSAASGAGNLGIWTALGNGTWLYNDGAITGTVNNQGYFYGTNSKTGKVTLRNPNTFTPGVGTLK